MIRYNTVLIVIALISIISLSGCINQEKLPANTVEIKNYNYSHYAFTPETINVPTGTEITWINRDSGNHTVTSDPTVTNATNRFDSGIIKPGGNYSHTFKDPGLYSYHCKVHTYMKGYVIAK